MNEQLSLVERIYRSIRFRVDRYRYQHRNAKRLVRKDFTIISNNCWGGVISEKYGIRKNSPTCGLLILGNDYTKFCANLKHYTSQKLHFIPMEQSKHYDTYKNMSFPVALCDDIEIYFMHYPSAEVAAAKWYRRCERINWNFLIYKLSEREDFTKQDMKEFAALPLENKLIIGEEKYTPDTVVIEGIHTYNGSEEDIIAEVFDEAKYFNTIAKRIER